MKTSIRPGKGSAKTGIVGGIFLLIFGLAFAFFVNSSMAESNDEGVRAGQIFLNIFLLGWIGLTIYMIVFYSRCLKNGKDTDLYEIDTEDDKAHKIVQNKSNDIVADVKERLEALEKLKNSGVISESEYNQQRSEILKYI